MKKMILSLALFICTCTLSFARGEAPLPSASGNSNAYLEQVYRLFSENGEYQDWSLEAKQEWVQLMPMKQDFGSSEEAIDHFIAKKYGKGDVQTVSIFYVLEDEWGDDFFWTLEQRAQFSEWTVQYFSSTQWDISLCYIPDSHVISPEDAVRIAWEVVSAAQKLPSNIKDTEFVYSISYGIGRIYAADYPPYYTIHFGIPLAEKDDQREPITPYYECSVSNLGEVMDSSYFRATESPDESRETQSNFDPLNYGEHFGEWNLDQKAAFSAEWKPLMDEYLTEHPNYRGFYYYETLYTYGIPSNSDISQNQAAEIAKNAAQQIGATNDYLERADAHFYFDVSNPNEPLWKVYWSTIFSANAKYQDALGYFVVISSPSGNVLDARIYEVGEPLENFR